MSRKRKKTIKIVEPSAPSHEEEVRFVNLVEPPARSKKEQGRTIELVAVPGHIARALRSSRITRDNLSESDAEKLRSFRNADELAKSILRLLINHADRGFTASEICEAVEGVGRNKVRLLLAGLGVDYCRRGKVLYSINPP